MLKLKKTNLTLMASQAMDTEDDSLFVQESLVQASLEKLAHKNSLTHQAILDHLSSSAFSSISSQEFVKILASTLHSNNLQSSSDVETCLSILQQLISLPHDQKQVKGLIKKQKGIDSLLLLSILWPVRSNQQCWKYVAYMIECYPAEIILNGKEYVEKWEEYFREVERKQKLNQQIKAKIKQYELFEKLKKNLQANAQKGFVDTYINL